MVSLGEIGTVHVCNHGDGCFLCSGESFAKANSRIFTLTQYLCSSGVRFVFLRQLLCHVSSGEHKGLLCNAIYCCFFSW